jgi:hypothetical protein
VLCANILTTSIWYGRFGSSDFGVNGVWRTAMEYLGISIKNAGAGAS